MWTKLASLVLEHLGITGKPDLHEICKRLGLRVKEVPLTGAHGALVRSKTASKGIISVRASLRETTQKRFTIAHEIGHFVIPYHKDLDNVCDARTLGRFGKALPRPELEANEFAAELLMPARLVRGPLQVDTPSLETIGSVATEYETSLTSATWRFLDLTDRPCAMIWSHKGNAIWYRTSDALPIELPLQELPASQSIAGRLFAGKRAPSAGSVDPYLWFKRDDAEHIHTLIEESLRLPNYDAVLTLLWANKMGRPIDSQEEELLPELTPEEFSIRRKSWPQ